MDRFPHKTTMIFPATLWQRAKRIVTERTLKGGMTRLVCDALSAYLDDLEKVTVSFETAWMRRKGFPPEEAQKIACYGGRWELPKLYGARVDRFTIAELEQHFLTGTWTHETAQLIYRQQQQWIVRGQPLVELPMTPPGWKGYPTQYGASAPEKAQTPKPAQDWDWALNLADCELLGDACTHQAECLAVRACVLAEAERAKATALTRDADDDDIT